MTGAYCVFAGLPSLWTDLPIGICVLEGFNQSHNLIYIAANLRRGDIYNRVGQLLLFGSGLVVVVVVAVVVVVVVVIIVVMVVVMVVIVLQHNLYTSISLIMALRTMPFVSMMNVALEKVRSERERRERETETEIGRERARERGRERENRRKPCLNNAKSKNTSNEKQMKNYA